MKPVHWVLLAVAAAGGVAIWYSRTHSTPAPVPSQPKVDNRAVALAAATDILNKIL